MTNPVPSSAFSDRQAAFHGAIAGIGSSDAATLKQEGVRIARAFLPFDAEPAQLFADAGANQRRVFADAAGENYRVRTVHCGEI